MAKSKDPRCKELIIEELEYVTRLFDESDKVLRERSAQLQTIADILRPFLNIPKVSCNCGDDN